MFESLIFLFNIVGLALEIVGFILILKSTIKLSWSANLPNAKGAYSSHHYVDPKTGKVPPHIESSPKPWIYRPAVIIVILGLSLQLISIIIQQLSTI